MSGFFGALRDDSSDSDGDKADVPSNKKIHSSTPRRKNQTPTPLPSTKVDIPAYEDLSRSRADEETVLQVVYGNDFSKAEGAWGCPRLQVTVRPPDVVEVFSQFLLSIQLSKQYPYVAPKIDILNSQGLTKTEQGEVMQLMANRAKELAVNGSVMILELVQVAEDFLLEHNRDPTQSAWEQMKERERIEKEKEMKAQAELSHLMNDGSTAKNPYPSSPSESITGRSLKSLAQSTIPEQTAFDSGDLERELMRQRQALEDARKEKLGLERNRSNSTVEVIESHADEDEEDEIDFDDDYYTNLGSSGTSRYKTDFIELGVLGRGGGGEVVKVRNRLDRRIYAIKKVILEAEEGRFAKYGAVQNRKLRREVTTISRMTHKHIVRYYQAWVEGDGGQNSELTGDGNGEMTTLGNELLEVVENDSDEEEESGRGWWAKSPNTRSNEDESSWGGSSSEDSSSDDSDGDSKKLSFDEENKELGFGSPLLSGFGFQNKAYESIYDRSKTRASSEDENSTDNRNIWDESSSVKVDGVQGKKILYIQMQYCESTLRKLIDDGEIAETQHNEVWRLVRQILEALAYIHERGIIHRYA